MNLTPKSFQAAAALLALGLAIGYVATVQSQTASITVSVPTLPGNTTQWGGSSVTSATSLSDAAGNPTAPMTGAVHIIRVNSSSVMVWGNDIPGFTAENRLFTGINFAIAQTLKYTISAATNAGDIVGAYMRVTWFPA
jgi:hypothetical protein